jgi:hypothetical protein
MNATPCPGRFGERTRVNFPVTLAAGELTAAGVLRDVSISGALIESSLDLPLFTNLVVTLPARAAHAAPRELAACVVRHAAAGMGVEWRDMACPTLRALLADTLRWTAA